MFKKTIAITTIVSLCSLIVLLNVTAPSWLGPLGILVVFILAYLLSLGLVTYFIYWSSRFVAYISRFFTARKPLLAFSFRRSYYFATVFAVAPVMLIGLQSVGSVGVYEFTLVTLFIVIGCIYISKKIN